MEHDPSEKPPIGLKPSWIWKGLRLREVLEAIARYTATGRTPHPEWYAEAKTLLNDPEVDKYLAVAPDQK